VSSRGAIVPVGYDVPPSGREASPVTFSTFGRSPSPPPVHYVTLRHGGAAPDSGPASMVEGAAAVAAAEQARMIPPPLPTPPEQDEGRSSRRSASSAPGGLNTAITNSDGGGGACAASPRPHRPSMGTFSLRRSGAASPTSSSNYDMPPVQTDCDCQTDLNEGSKRERSYQNLRIHRVCNRSGQKEVPKDSRKESGISLRTSLMRETHV